MSWVLSSALSGVGGRHGGGQASKPTFPDTVVGGSVASGTGFLGLGVLEAAQGCTGLSAQPRRWTPCHWLTFPSSRVMAEVPQPEQSSMWGSGWHTQVPSNNQPCGQGVRGGRGPTWTSVGFAVSHVLL